jgi:NB-ARC domain
LEYRDETRCSSRTIIARQLDFQLFAVPAPPSYLVGTQNVANLKKLLLDDSGECRVVTVHGCGGVGKPTACNMLANDDTIRQRFSDGVIWVELGEAASSDALIERLAHAVKRSGGEKTAKSIVHYKIADVFELGKVEFQICLTSARSFFVLDNIWKSKDRIFNRWIDVLRDIPGGKSSLLCSSRTPLGQKDI